MNDKPLNKRERAYIWPAVVLGWDIEFWPGRKSGLWDGYPDMPVSVGAVAESLIVRGYLERVKSGIPKIRATHKARALKCSVGCCVSGKLYDENGIETGKCPDCDEHGMAWESTTGEATK